MENTLLTSNYFNAKAILHCIVFFLIFVIIDVAIFYTSSDNFLSKSFYSKFIVCLGYLLASKNESPLEKSDSSLEFTFHFSSYLLCIWLGLSNLISNEIEVSKVVGIFLLFGVFAGFNITAELLKFNKSKYVEKPFKIVLVEGVLKGLLSITLISALVFLLVGEWSWFIKPFYEW